MASHTHKQLASFLREADRALSASHRLVIIGGAAALLNYGALRPTSDIDTIQPLTPELERAFERARERTGFDLPVQSVGTYDAPYNFEVRVQTGKVDGLIRLSLFVPERHDLALMKIVRGYDHDLQVIWEMHQAKPFDMPVLVERFQTEMTHVIGRTEGLRLSFLAAIERLFGLDVAVRVESALEIRS